MTSDNEIVFSQIIEHTEDCLHEYRVYEDGSSRVNIWEFGDNTGGDGKDISIVQYIHEYGGYFLSLAQTAYLKAVAEVEELAA